MDKNVVAGKPHKYVIDLMHAAARNGQVSLTVRRRVLTPGENMFYFFLLFLCSFVCSNLLTGEHLHILLPSNYKKTTWTGHMLTICVQDQCVVLTHAAFLWQIIHACIYPMGKIFNQTWAVL